MGGEKARPLLILSKDDPEGVLELPDSRCQLLLKHVTTTDYGAFEARKSLETSERRSVSSVQQTEDVRVILLNLLVGHFKREELRTLCFYLGIDYETLPGEEKVGIAREMLIYLEHRKRLYDLVKCIERTRPDVYEDLLPGVIEIIRESSRASQGPLPRRGARGYRAKID